MSPCPGCGVVLPGSGEPWDRRTLASEACHALYGEVAGYELEHVIRLGKWHQLLVDTYAAQHAGPETPPIGTAFALIGLALTLEDGWDGLRVREAHQQLAREFEGWPRFELPPSRGSMTVFDLAMAGSPEAHVERLGAWAADVWAAWSASHAAVRALISERLPGELFPAEDGTT
jgi:Family of unknown function (DUF5946)